MIQLVDSKLLEEMSAEARASARLRMNRNFHVGDDALAHRLLNAVEPGSYIAPHRHLSESKDETLIVLRGKFGLVIFDSDGNIVQTQVMEAGGDLRGVDIPHDTWHSVVSLQKGGVFFEAKAGPYLTFTPEEKAVWAPAENAPDAARYLRDLVALF